MNTHILTTQVNEPVPLLAEEPLRAEPAAAELALLAKAVDKAGKAVKVCMCVCMCVCVRVCAVCVCAGNAGQGS